MTQAAPDNADSAAPDELTDGGEPAPARQGWVGQLDQQQFSVADSIGGWRGAVESLLPGLVFVVAYVLTRTLVWPLALSGGIALVFIVVRLLQRSSLTQASAGMLGVLVGVIWAALSGRAENYFAWGLITNAGFALLMLISLLARRPAIVLLMEFAVGLPSGWRQQPWGPLLQRRGTWATWVWVAVFSVRLAVQAPLYFGGHVVGLGVWKLVLGLPLFALGGWLTWVLMRGIAPKSSADVERVSPDSGAEDPMTGRQD